MFEAKLFCSAAIALIFISPAYCFAQTAAVTPTVLTAPVVSHSKN
jgi:hypothetical protein